MPRMDCGTFELYYEDSRGAHEPLVLVHGSWVDNHQWDRVAPTLAESFRVIKYDRRGHSQSSCPPQFTVLADHIRDLETLVSMVARPPAHIAANSYGAIVALGFAIKRPDMVRSLSLHEPPLTGLISREMRFAPMLSEMRERIEAIRVRLGSGDKAGAAMAFVDEIALGPGSWERFDPELKRTFVKNSQTWLNEVRDPASVALEEEVLMQVTNPVQLTSGSLSPPVFGAIEDSLAEKMRLVSRHTYEGAGHIPHVTHPREFSETTLRFCFESSRPAS
jgi:pimeloyl-ACP methyl ester carboxylesterase